MVAGVFTTAIMAPGERIKCLMQVSSAISKLIYHVYSLYCMYHISSINTTSSISTPVRYYSNINNIEMVVIFISNAPSNSTACHFATPDIIAKYRVTMAVSLIVFQVIMNSCKERGKMYIYSVILNW